jgi:hypothetical protein
MIVLLKSIYQTFNVKLNLYLSLFLFKSKTNSEIIKKKLLKRNFDWNVNGKTKVFAIFSINNWEEVLKDELSLFGEVHHFTWQNISEFFDTKYDWEIYMKLLNQRLISEFDEFYDSSDKIIIFLYASDFTIFQSTLDYIKRKNTFLISFCWDDLLYFKGKVNGQPIGVKKMCQVVDLNLTMSPEAIPQYKLYNSACYFWDSIELKNNNCQLNEIKISDFYVLFIGSKYGRRSKFIEDLRKQGVDVICYGNGWENPQLEYFQMIHEIRKAPLTLGFSNVGYTSNITTIKGRDFEVPFFGGLYLTQFSKGLRLYYDDDEVLTYENFNECLSKIRYFQNNQKLANIIRKKGYIKAQNKASWASRFKYLDCLISEITNPFAH